MGDELVHAWRRSYATRPPALAPEYARKQAADPRYSGLSDDLLPRAESLADTVARVLPYWEGTIVPELRAGRSVLIVAHGNSLRGLVKHIDGLRDEEIAGLEIPTGIPLVYRLAESLEPIEHYYLGHPAAVRAASASTAAQAATDE